MRFATRIGVRLLGALGVLVTVATLTFLAEHLMPGDPANTILGGAGSHPTAAQLAEVNHQYGFDRPLVVQYADYLRGLATGNLGTSYVLKQPVTTVIDQQAGATMWLTLSALVLSWVLALVWTLSTAGRGRVASGIGSGVELVAAGLPQYWLGIILLVVFAFRLHWFPVAGGSGLAGLALPALTLALPLAGFLGQVTRDEFATVLQQPFIVSARARGMSDRGVRARHALRHAVLPGITLSGWALGSLFSGAVLVEAVFVRPGLGRVLVAAVEQQDMPVVVGVTMLIAGVYVIANLLVDVAYAVVDPRLRRPVAA
jgi:peptide/nickel transport system permease protein